MQGVVGGDISLPFVQGAGYIKLTGIPFFATKNDILEFLGEFRPRSSEQIQYTQGDVGGTGEAFAMLESKQQAIETVANKNGKTIFIDTIEVTYQTPPSINLPAEVSDADRLLIQACGFDTSEQPVVQTGMPATSSKEKPPDAPKQSLFSSVQLTPDVQNAVTDALHRMTTSSDKSKTAQAVSKQHDRNRDRSRSRDKASAPSRSKSKDDTVSGTVDSEDWCLPMFDKNELVQQVKQWRNHSEHGKRQWSRFVSLSWFRFVCPLVFACL